MAFKFRKSIDSVEKSGWVSMLVKPISLICNLLYTPMLLNYLGNEKYGLWATVLSIMSWINYFDVGIGNGLRNSLSKYISVNDYQEAQKVVSTAYGILTIIAMVIWGILLVVLYAFNWHSVFSTDVDMKVTLFISFFFICINFVLALSNTLLYALQMSEKVAVRNLVVQGLNIIGLFLISKFSNERLELMAFLFGGTQLIVNIGNTIQVFSKYNYLRPRLRFYQSTYLKEICTLGIKFFIIQIMCMVMFTVDDMLITHFFGAETNTPFSIVNKVYNTGYSVFAAFMVPYWSATTVAVEKKDYLWIKISIKKAIGVLLIFVIGYFLMILLFDPLVNIWLGHDLDYQSGLLFIMAVFYSLYSILNIESQFINGIGKVDVEMIIYIILGIVNIPLSIFLGVTMNFGTVGIRGATLLLVFVADVILGYDLYKKINSHSENY